MKIASILFAAAAMPAAASAADLHLLCPGMTGHWQIVDSSVKEREGGWKQDLSDGAWRVTATGDGKCRVFKSSGAIDFDVDTSGGDYAVVNYDQGKPQPVDTYRTLVVAGVDPNTWSATFQITPSSASNRYFRMTLVRAGDLLTYMTAVADRIDGAYVPTAVAVHRRIP